MNRLLRYWPLAFLVLFGSLSARAQTIASPMLWANPQFLDCSSGQCVPAVGGTVQTYIANTNTPLATCASSVITAGACATPNANPLTLNSGGYNAAGSGNAGIWMLNRCYKFVVKDGNAVTLWTQDNVCSVGYLIAQLTASFAGPGGAALIGYKSSVSGTITRTVASVLNEGLSLWDFCTPGLLDNGPCINTAIATVDALSLGRITCSGIFPFTTPISAPALTSPGLAITSQGLGSCLWNYTGPAITNGAAVLFNSPNQSTILELAGVTLTPTVNPVDVMLDIAGVVNSNVHDNLLNPIGGTGTAMRFRGTQLGKIEHNIVSYGASNAIPFMDQLEGPVLLPITSTITSSIGASGGGTFTVASGALCTQANSQNLLAYVRIGGVGHEVIKGTCATGSPNTFTIGMNCGFDGASACRAQQGTVAEAHTNGSAIYNAYSFPADQISVRDNTFYAVDNGIFVTTGRQQYESNKIFEATTYGISNINGFFNSIGGNQIENSTSPATATYLQNKAGQAPGTSGPTLHLSTGDLFSSGPITISTGTFKADRTVIATGLTISANAFSSSIMNSKITSPPTINEADLVFFNNRDGFEAPITTLYGQGSLGGPFGPVTSKSGPPGTFGPGKVSLELDGGGTPLTASGIKFTTNGTDAGSTYISLSGGGFLVGNSFASSLFFCSTPSCAAGTFSVVGTTATRLTGPEFQIASAPFPWAGIYLFGPGLGIQVVSVADADHLTLNSAPGDASYFYNTQYGNFSVINGGTLTIPNLGAPSGQTYFVCINDAGTLIKSVSVCHV